MAKTLAIPSALHRPLKALLELPIEVHEGLLAGLRAAGAKSSPDGFLPAVRAAGIPESDASDVVSAIISVYGARDGLRLSPDEFAEKLVATTQQFPEPQRPNVSNWDVASDLLKHLLSLHGTVGVTAKAFVLRAQQANVFRGSQIVTDLRPIYSPDPSVPPVGALVLHTLRITKRDRERVDSDVHVVMDNDDLRSLRDDIDRALAKETSMRMFFARDAFPILADEGQDS